MAGAKVDTNIEDIRRVFTVFDKDNDGSLTKEEIRNVLLEAEVQFTDEQLEEFMNKLDRDGKYNQSVSDC
ncbi:hypothetical protein LSH36_174g08024 [Paralvinella palmiformis]|uniref:EF-hand domain-containing protein n=1 Tax=Paralvinella palmiformis TaxID=53620 RepID=A0AAD9N7G3_9ANNE|nr:hypothetical protein LSH36_174g08024 [Paralvinella palmiformis]